MSRFLILGLALAATSPAIAQTAPSGPPVEARLASPSTAPGPASLGAEAVRAIAGEGEARDQWAILTAFLGLPDTAAQASGDALSEAVARDLGSADRDGDGWVSTDEIRSFALSEPDTARRAATVAILSAADLDGDGRVAPDERDALLSRWGGTTLTPATLSAAISATEAGRQATLLAGITFPFPGDGR